MKTNVLIKSEAYAAPMTEVYSVASEAFIAVSDSTFTTDPWRGGTDNWCD